MFKKKDTILRGHRNSGDPQKQFKMEFFSKPGTNYFPLILLF